MFEKDDALTSESPDGLYEVAFDDLESLPNETDVIKAKIMSFDIECLGRPGIFPDAKQDPIIQVIN